MYTVFDHMSTEQAPVDKDGFNAVDQLSATGFGISKIDTHQF